MSVYQEMYHLIFNSVTDAIELLQKNDAEAARKLLIHAQQECEELFLDND
jgi:hypothetical protein